MMAHGTSDAYILDADRQDQFRRWRPVMDDENAILKFDRLSKPQGRQCPINQCDRHNKGVAQLH